MHNLTAIIPARSGSKRIKNKNLLTLNDKNFINIACDFAFNCNIKKIIVSSDSQEYLDSVISKDVVLHKRSFESSNDDASDFDVVNEISQKYKINTSESICWLRPCSPFRSVQLFDEMYQAHNKFSKAVRSIKIARDRPEWMYKLCDDGKIKPVDIKSYNVQSKFLEDKYIISGQVEINFIKNILHDKSLISVDSIGIIDNISPHVIDIDYIDEYRIANAVLSESERVLNYLQKKY